MPVSAFRPAPPPIVAEHCQLAAGAEAVGIPTAVGRLCCGEPIERRDHGGLGLDVAALRFDQAEPAGG